MKQIIFKLSFVTFLPFALLACGNDDEPEVTKQEPPVVNNTTGDPKTQEADNDPDVYEVNMVPEARQIELNAQQKSLVTLNNDFSFNLFRHVYAKYGSKSVGCSPLSVSYLLGMLNDGAQGQTSDEISLLLGYGQGDKGLIDDFCRTMMEELPLADPSATLKVANSLFVDHNMVLEENFCRQLENNYHAKVSAVDFSQPGTLDVINSWCKEQTEGIIPSIVDKLNSSTLFMMLNAAYFKATWAENFEPEAAKPAEFMGNDGASYRLPMLHWNGLIWYCSNDIYSTINLPYGSGDNWSMMVLLPNEGKSIGDVVNSLSSVTWTDNLKSRHLNSVDAKMPKFSTESDLLLNDILADMGAKTMFSPELADFSPMTKNMKKVNGHTLNVDMAKQKTGFAVSEEGTELTTVTINAGIHGVPFTGKASEFHADRPFLYIIQEASTGAIFFIGTFMGE